MLVVISFKNVKFVPIVEMQMFWLDIITEANKLAWSRNKNIRGGKFFKYYLARGGTVIRDLVVPFL